MILRLGTVLFFLTAAPTFSQAPALVPKQVTDAARLKLRSFRNGP